MLKKILLSFLAIFGLTFLLSTNSYAVSDVSVTYTSVPSHYQNLFPTCNGECLSDYKYLIVERSNYLPTTYTSLAGLFYIRFNGSNTYNYFVDYTSTFSVYELPQFSDSSNNYIQWRQNLPSEIFDDGGITFTLTESYQSGIVPEGSLSITSNGTYDVTNYASAVVDVSTRDSWVVELFKGGFWNVATAIVALIVPILALFLVFRLIHGLIYGKGL